VHKYLRHNIITLCIAAAVLAVCIGAYPAGLQGVFERKAYDARVRLLDRLGLGSDRTSGKTVIVGVDERSIIREKPLLFIYDDIGRFIKRMDEYKADIIGLDVILVHKQSEKLKNAVKIFLGDRKEDAGDTIGRTMEDIGERLDRSALEPIIDAGERVKIVQVVHGDLVPFFYGVSPFIKNMTIADASLTDGAFDTNDGVIRKQAFAAAERPSFASTLYLLATGKQYKGSIVFINYRMAGEVPFFRFDDVMSGKVDKSSFAGKTVILGYISGYEDVHATPLARDISPGYPDGGKNVPGQRGGKMAGPLIHGLILETMLTGTSVGEAPLFVHIVILICLAAAAYTAIICLKPLWASLGLLSMIVLFFIADVILFSHGYYVHLFPQLATPVLVAVMVYPYRYFVEEKMRRRVQKVFGYYIDKRLLERLIEADSEALLDGEARNICIFFLDIRNFTQLSTTKTAREMVQFLNFFFGELTGIIQRNSGFVNKFIGDGILAFFMTGQNPVGDGIAAAREITAETARLNEGKGFEQFIGDWEVRVGIGIHYGEVILGNIGSEQKMDFTIIGEHVNIASRIESLTKEAGASILISDDARKAAGDGISWMEVGHFTVKGIDHSISLYTVE
jgi:class 3 adenylate cyclase/CHASE2 domain-containing sensor protein